jgi:6-phosphogluconolactonase
MLETYPSAGALAEACAHGVEACLAQALMTRGRAALVATGGRSPGRVYDRLREAKVDWARVIVTLSDERCVDRASPDANARQLDERLFQGEPAKAHFLPLWPCADEAALRALMPFDAVLLGMGEDGHIASLIPGSAALAEGLDPASGKLVLPVEAGIGAPPLPRVTLTLAALLPARSIFLLIAGEAKREVISRARAGEDLPVRAILAHPGLRVLWAPSH